MFIVLSVISKDVVDLWEAVITFLMFPLVVILAYLVNKCVKRIGHDYYFFLFIYKQAEKNFFASNKIDMEEEEQTLILSNYFFLSILY
jgi:transcriptional antiterminator